MELAENQETRSCIWKEFGLGAVTAGTGNFSHGSVENISVRNVKTFEENSMEWLFLGLSFVFILYIRANTEYVSKYVADILYRLFYKEQ